MPLGAFKKMKSIRNFVVHNDVQCRPEVQNVATSPCGKCKKTCHLISKSTEINNSATKRKVKVAGGTCKSRNVVYAIRCKTHDLPYVGHTGEELLKRISKHRYDFKNRPDNNEHLRETHHDFESDIEASILNADLLKVY